MVSVTLRNAAGELPAKTKGKGDREVKRRRILDAAERVFANSGYEGAGMRKISVEAGVAQALIHYHFDTKERLFEEVVARRSQEINQLREKRLAALFEESNSPVLEDIADVLLRPTIEVGHRLAHSANDFARILVTIANSADQRSKELAEQYYDPMARRFIAAFEKTTPGLGHENAVWAYMFAIGVGMTMMAQTGRPQRLSGGLCDDSDVEAMLARIIPFITAGIRAVIGIDSNKAPKRPNRENIQGRKK
jgi:AcrR family transcriptional regulator